LAADACRPSVRRLPGRSRLFGSAGPATQRNRLQMFHVEHGASWLRSSQATDSRLSALASPVGELPTRSRQERLTGCAGGGRCGLWASWRPRTRALATRAGSAARPLTTVSSMEVGAISTTGRRSTTRRAIYLASRPSPRCCAARWRWRGSSTGCRWPPLALTGDQVRPVARRGSVGGCPSGRSTGCSIGAAGQRLVCSVVWPLCRRSAAGLFGRGDRLVRAAGPPDRLVRSVVRPGVGDRRLGLFGRGTGCSASGSAWPATGFGRWVPVRSLDRLLDRLGWLAGGWSAR
jgi:hypothetical protein